MSHTNRQRGVTLIELMISLVLGSIITAGVITLYAKNTVNNRINDGLSEIQENSRFVQHFMSQSLRAVANIGCPHIKNVVPTNHISPLTAPLTFTETTVLGGHEATSATTWSPLLPSNLTGLVAANTDVLTLKHAAPDSVHLSSAMATASSNLIIPTRLNLQSNDVVIISDCESADIFQIPAITGGSDINLTATDENFALSKAYQADAQIAKLNVSYYYIGDTDRTNGAGQPIYALYRQDISGTNDELVEGVEDMQITFGIDSTEDLTANVFQNASTVETGTNWENATSVKISHLVSTTRDVNNAPLPYSFQGNTTTPSDRKLRRQTDSFHTLRNRSL